MANGKPGRPAGLPKTGGRQKGTTNKSTHDRERVLKEAQSRALATLTPEQIDALAPLDVMVMAYRFLLKENNILGAAAFAEKAAPYVHAKLATTTVNAHIRRDVTQFDDAELAAIAGSDGGSDGTGEAPARTH